jgi:hypothetical protein
MFHIFKFKQTSRNAIRIKDFYRKMRQKKEKDKFKRKIAAAVVIVRRAGALPTFDAINHFS